jgi:hypothetical protein
MDGWMDGWTDKQNIQIYSFSHIRLKVFSACISSKSLNHWIENVTQHWAWLALGWVTAIKKRRFSSLGVGGGANNSSLETATCYEMLHNALELAGSCEHSNETSVSIKCREFLD